MTKTRLWDQWVKGLNKWIKLIGESKELILHRFLFSFDIFFPNLNCISTLYVILKNLHIYFKWICKTFVIYFFCFQYAALSIPYPTDKDNVKDAVLAEEKEAVSQNIWNYLDMLIACLKWGKPSLSN